MPRDATRHMTLGTLIRDRREKLRMSQVRLAQKARVARATLIRMEQDSEVRPTAIKLAQVVAVLRIEPDELSEVLVDEPVLLDDALHYMERAKAFVRVSNEESNTPPALRQVASEPPALVVIKNGQMAEVRGQGADAVGGALKEAGWLVTRPD